MVDATLRQYCEILVDAEDPVETAKEIVDKIEQWCHCEPILFHSRLARFRQLLVCDKISKVEAGLLVHRSDSQNRRFREAQLSSIQKKEGINRLSQFESPEMLKQRVAAFDFEMPATIDNLIDSMVLFCSRIGEIQTLKLHPQRQTISGFSKSRDDTGTIERPFVSIYDNNFGTLIKLQNILTWIQSTDWGTIFANQNAQFTRHLKEKYSSNITAKTLRQFGVDLVIQHFKPANNMQEQILAAKATRHCQFMNTEMPYLLINKTVIQEKSNEEEKQDQQINLRQKTKELPEFPKEVIGFKLSLVNAKYYIAKKKIGGKIIQVPMNKYADDPEKRIRDYCEKHQIPLQ